MTSSNDKFRWAVQAGDQDPKSADDKPCGDHFIKKSLECHDGDAHRPNPGNNPYWQGDRKGPPSEDPKGKGKSEETNEKGDKKRDRTEITKKAKKHKEHRESPEGPDGGAWTIDRASEWAGSKMEENKKAVEDAHREQTGEDIDWNSTFGNRKKHEVAEMTLRDTQRFFAGEMPGKRGKETGVDPRRMSRPEPGDKPITFDPTNKVRVPPPGARLYNDMMNMVDWGKGSSDGGSASKPKKKDAEASLLTWTEAGNEGALMALDSFLPDLPGDSAEGRPCGEDENPEQGHCNPNMGAPAPKGARPGPMSDSDKVLRKMGPPRAAPEGVGLGPKTKEDPYRKQRTVQHVNNLKNSDPKDTKRTAWAVSKMFGGSAKESDKGISGNSPSMSKEQAQQQYDDARHSLEQSGWKNTSEMGGRTTWSKNGAQISMNMGQDGKGAFANQFLVHKAAPAKAPAKKGLFGWAIGAESEEEDSSLPFPGAAPLFKKKGKSEDSEAALAGSMDWTSARPCGDEEEYPEKCTDGGGMGFDEDPEDQPYEDSDYPDDDAFDSDYPEDAIEDELSMPDPTLEAPPKSKPMDLKKELKHEKKQAGDEQKQRAEEQKKHSKMSTYVPRDPRLGPGDYHQSWQIDPTGPSFVNEAKKLVVRQLEQGMQNAQTPEEKQAFYDKLMNGVPVGGYDKAAKHTPGDPGLEDFVEPRDEGPVMNRN